MILSASCLVACKTKQTVYCTTLPNTALVITTGESYWPMIYTGYKIEAYKPNVDSAILDTVINVDFGQRTGSDGLQFHESYVQQGFDKHDWVITIYPDGKQFKIQNVVRDYRAERMAKVEVEGGIKCYNGFTFTVNGEKKTSVNYNPSYAPDYEYVYIKYN